MRLLFVSYNLAGGGAERVLVNLLDGLVSHRVEPVCLLYDEIRAYPIPRGVSTHVLALPGSVNRRNRIRRMAALMEEVKPDAVLSFLHGVNLEVILAHLVAKRRQRLLVSEHNVPSTTIAGRGAERKKRAIRRLYPKADRVVCVSRAIAGDLVGSFALPPKKAAVIYNPVNLAHASEAGRAAVTETSWLDDGVPVFLNVASLKESKGHALLLGAFARVRAKRKCRLIVLGSGPLRFEAREDVAFLGFQENPFKFMAKASALVLSSRREGFPNVILEAMACGLPVVSTAWRGAEEIIDDERTGLLTPLGDEAALAAAMERVLDERGLASAATEFVARFSTEKILEQYLALL